MEDISNKTLAMIMGVAVVLSITAILFSTNTFDLTGRATSSGQGKVNLTVTSSASISVTNNIEFGNGTIESGYDTAYLDSEQNVSVGGTWNWTSLGPQYIVIQNDGNVNLSLEVNSSVNASGLLGGTGAYTQGFEFKIQEQETGACGSGIHNGSSYAEGDFTDYTPGNLLLVCDNFDSGTDSNELNMSVNLSVPRDATKDTVLEALITFIGTS